MENAMNISRDMAKDEIIAVNDLTKVYRIYNKPIDRFKEILFKRKKHSEFVALNRVSFLLKKGETLGIIGENGAGKSTLLQLIAGTLTPTSGEISVKGRVLALLELGVGFHPDFTGRENIFFYGDILGFSREFVQSKIREIIEFSELDNFMDRQLKTYSTGMQMRLAFSLISSLDPDVLIVDEALSVGDMHFQKKCIDRITDFKKKGITIIFCSHSTYQVNVLCEKVIWLKNGRIEMYGDPQRIIPAYDYYQLEKGKDVQSPSGLRNESVVWIKELDLVNELPLKRGDDLKVRLSIASKNEDIPYHVYIALKVDPDWGVFGTGTHMLGKEPLCGKRKEVLITFPNIPIIGGFYYIHVRVFDDSGFVVYYEKTLQPFEVVKDSLERGVCYLENHWDIRDL
jgi:ABC-type polysaccharide/polyol phosphate transport system ATPase subunit